MRLSPSGITVPGRHTLVLRKPDGRILLRLEGKGPADYLYRDLRGKHRLPGGLALVEVRTEKGRITQKVVY